MKVVFRKQFLFWTMVTLLTFGLSCGGGEENTTDADADADTEMDDVNTDQVTEDDLAQEVGEDVIIEEDLVSDEIMPACLDNDPGTDSPMTATLTVQEGALTLGTDADPFVLCYDGEAPSSEYVLIDPSSGDEFGIYDDIDWFMIEFTDATLMKTDVIMTLNYTIVPDRGAPEWAVDTMIYFIPGYSVDHLLLGQMDLDRTGQVTWEFSTTDYVGDNWDGKIPLYLVFLGYNELATPYATGRIDYYVTFEFVTSKVCKMDTDCEDATLYCNLSDEVCMPISAVTYPCTGTKDDYEGTDAGNFTSSKAYDLTANGKIGDTEQTLNLNLCPSDEDWFKATAADGDSFYFDIAFGGGVLDDNTFTAILMNSAGEEIDIIDTSVLLRQIVGYALQADDYFLRIFMSTTWTDTTTPVDYTLRTLKRTEKCSQDADCSKTTILRAKCDTTGGRGACVPLDGAGAVALKGLCDSDDDCSSGFCAIFDYNHTSYEGGRNVCTIECDEAADCTTGMGAGYTCIADYHKSMCVMECASDEQCPLGYDFDDGTWRFFLCDAADSRNCVNWECTTDPYCVENDNGHKCIMDAAIEEKRCGCNEDPDCLEGFYCNATDKICVEKECGTDTDCIGVPEGSICLNGGGAASTLPRIFICGCVDPFTDCNPAKYCDNARGDESTFTCLDKECNTDSDCGTGNINNKHCFRTAADGYICGCQDSIIDCHDATCTDTYPGDLCFCNDQKLCAVL